MTLTTLIKIISILIMIEAAVFIVNPRLLHKMIALFSTIAAIRLAGIVKLALSLIFLISATSTNRPWVLILLGLIMLISAMFSLLQPSSILKLCDFFSRRSQIELRFYAVLELLTGLLILWAA